MHQQGDSNNETLQRTEFDIIVNGRVKKWKESKITFAQVVVLAFGIFENNLVTAYTVTYTFGGNSKLGGTMVNGDFTDVKNNMVFNVTATSKS